jgi:hypothetical protein
VSLTNPFRQKANRTKMIAFSSTRPLLKHGFTC